MLGSNIGVLQTTVAEVVTVEAHQGKQVDMNDLIKSHMVGSACILNYAICMVSGVSWPICAFPCQTLTTHRSIIGSGLGGTLADPVRNYPGYFEAGTIFEKYPYLLPNLVCTGVVLFGMVVGILFLEETHEDKRDRKDVGIETGRWLLSFFRSSHCGEKVGFGEESLTLLVDSPPGYSSQLSSPALNPVAVGDLPLRIQESAGQTQQRSRKSLPNPFTRQVILNIVSYGILAYHTISAEQLLPVLFSMPESHQAPNLPFKFVGGFALPTKQIGFILSVQGFIQMFITIFVFPVVNRRLGSVNTFRLVVLTYPILYILVPYLTLVPEQFRMPGIYGVLVWKVTAQAFSFPSLAIMLANAAPSRKVLGTLNGVAASSASLCRAFGPTLSGLVQSAGLSVGALGLPWWANSLVALIGSLLCLCMVEENRAYSKADEANMEIDDGYEPYLDVQSLESGTMTGPECTAETNESANALPSYQRHADS